MASDQVCVISETTRYSSQACLGYPVQGRYRKMGINDIEYVATCDYTHLMQHLESGGSFLVSVGWIRDERAITVAHDCIELRKNDPLLNKQTVKTCEFGLVVQFGNGPTYALIPWADVMVAK